MNDLLINAGIAGMSAVVLGVGYWRGWVDRGA